jgi:hypothetical protein
MVQKKKTNGPEETSILVTLIRRIKVKDKRHGSHFKVLKQY